MRVSLCKPDVQITYDIYKPYIHKAASSRELLLVSRVSVAFFGLVMACASVIFYKVLLLSYQSCICMSACGILGISHGLCQRHILQGIPHPTPDLHMHVGMLHSIKSMAAEAVVPLFFLEFGQWMHAAAELCHISTHEMLDSSRKSAAPR